jgi:hypothetical protein
MGAMMVQSRETETNLKPPRLFLRRTLAFVLDSFLISIMAGFLMLVVSAATGLDLGAPGFARVIECAPAPAGDPLAKQIEALWPLAYGEMRNHQVCQQSYLGGAPSRLFYSETVRKDDGGADRHFVQIAVDDKGNPVSLPGYPDVRLPVMVLLFAFFAASGRRSPAKLILSLKVRRQDLSALTWGRALLREGLKLLPLLALFLLQAWTWYFKLPQAPDLAALVAAARGPAPDALSALSPPLAMLAGLTAAWWLLPFLFWRGQTWYDRLSGTMVIEGK